MVTLVVNKGLSDPLGNYLTGIAGIYLLLASFLFFKWLMNWAIAEISILKSSMHLVLGFMGYGLLRCGLLLKTAFSRQVESINLIIPTLLYLLVSALLLWVWGRYCNQLRPRFDLGTRWYYGLFTACVLIVAVAGITLTTFCELLPNHSANEGACINADTALDICSCELTGLMLLLVSIDLKEVFVLSGSYSLDIRTGGGPYYVVRSFFSVRNLPWRIFFGLRLFSIYSLLRGLLLIAYIFGGEALNEQMTAMVLFYTIEIMFLVTSVTILVGPPSAKSDPRLQRRAKHEAAVSSAATRLLNTHLTALNATREESRS